MTLKQCLTNPVPYIRSKIPASHWTLVKGEFEPFDRQDYFGNEPPTNGVEIGIMTLAPHTATPFHRFVGTETRYVPKEGRMTVAVYFGSEVESGSVLAAGMGHADAARGFDNNLVAVADGCWRGLANQTDKPVSVFVITTAPVVFDWSQGGREALGIK